jgi:mannose-1-phosphate guanylyltransferase
MVLCAGLGTRLTPLTDELPKPLLPFGDRALLQHALAALAAAGLERPVVNVHHMRAEFKNELEHLGIDVQVIDEPRLRGTAGGVCGALPVLGRGPVVVLNGDAVFTAVPKDFAHFAPNLQLLLAVVPRERGEGTVGVGDDGRVVRLRGEEFGEERRGGDYIGLCSISDVGLRALPERGCLIGDFALPLLRRGEKIGTYPFLSPVWLPGDDLAGYLRANLEWVQRRGETSWVATSARVASEVELSGALVGAHAVVEGRGRLERSVIWPGGRAVAPLSDSIVTRTGRVVSALRAGESP